MEFLNDTLIVAGSALRGGALAVTELVRLAREHGLERTLSYTLTTGGGQEKAVRFTGADLAALLPLLGLAEDSPADTPVAAAFKDGLRLDFTLAQLRRAAKPVLLAWAAGGLPLVGPTGMEPLYTVFTEAEGLSKAAGNSGGPLRLVAEGVGEGSNAPGCGKWLCLLAAGEWDGSVPARPTRETDPGPVPPPVEPPAEAALTLRLNGRETRFDAAVLAALPRIRAWFAARDGRFAFEGVPLRALLETALRPGEALPARLYAANPGGYGHELPTEWVLRGAESRYQPGRRREPIAAWAMNGALLPPGEGPLRLVAENEIACWIKGLSEITG